MKLKNKFIIIVPVYNAKNLISDCLESIFNQDFEDLGVIIRDDVSTDGTDEIIKNLLSIELNESQTRYNGKDVIFIRNKSKLYPVGNTYESVIDYVEDENSIIGVVDGDDRLYVSDAVSKINKIYETQDKWFVWSQHINSDGSAGQSKKLPPDDFISSSRNYWSTSHFRTSKTFLFKKLNKTDILDPFVPNSYYTFSGDAAFLFPFCEMCLNEKSYFLDEILYYYNNNLPTNEHNKNIQNAIKYGNYIRSYGKKYKKL
jgi:glycosyltransferase involved in cell wall biosynthesis